MPGFEYKVVAAPRKGLKAKDAKTPEARFAHAIAALMNEQAREGWEYLRTDTLPMEERKGLTGKTTIYQNLLVFRRAVGPSAEGPRRPVVTAIPGPDATTALPEPPRLGPPPRPGAGTGGAAPTLGSALGSAAAPTQARGEEPADEGGPEVTSDETR